MTTTLDLDELYIRMPAADRRRLHTEARRLGARIMDVLDGMIRSGLTAAAKAEGDDLPTFERQGNHLSISANPRREVKP